MHVTKDEKEKKAFLDCFLYGGLSVIDEIRRIAGEHKISTEDAMGVIEEELIQKRKENNF